MGMEDCPCCLPPWTWSRNDPTGSLLVGTIDFNGGLPTAIKRYSLNGDFISNVWVRNSIGAVSGVRDIAVNPLTGRIYFVWYDRVYCIDNFGNPIWDAIESVVNREPIAIAVSKQGHVYTSNVIGSPATAWQVTQRNALTGAVNWTYSGPSTTPLAGGLCCDQSGNVYGIRLDPSNTLFSLDSSGNVRYSVSVTVTGDTPQGCTDCAVSPDGTQLLVTKASTSNRSEFIIDSSNGSVISAVISAEQLSVAEWDDFGNYYTGGVSRIRKNGSTLHTITNPSFGVTGLAFDTTTNNVYASMFRQTASPNHSLRGINASNFLIWGVDGGAAEPYQCVEFSRGRVGAFGAGR